MSKSANLVGNRYGRLKVADRAYSHGGHSYWICECDCGGYTVARGSHLASGNITSCGCRRGRITHGVSGSRLHIAWRNMKARCTDPKNKFYHRYGGRGIKVCDEWCNDFQKFYAWAMENGYDETAPRGECTLDRIDNNGNYEPSNCRWSTAREQANNTSRTRIVEFRGTRHSVSDWARITGIKQSTLSMRINKYGWSAEKALTTEVRP